MPYRNMSCKISGTPEENGIFTFAVHAENSDGYTEKSFSIIIPFSDECPPEIIGSEISGYLLPAGASNSPYGFKISAAGTTPITWSLTDGSTLPDGLKLSTSGYVYGTPATEGDYTFRVQAENSSGTDSADLSIKISAPVILPASFKSSIITEYPEPAEIGKNYICQLIASGDQPIT